MSYVFYPGCSLDGTAKDFHRSTLAVAGAAGAGPARAAGLDLLRLHGRPQQRTRCWPTRCRPRTCWPPRGQTVAVACAACYSRLKMANHHIAGDAAVPAARSPASSAADYDGPTPVRHLLEILGRRHGAATRSPAHPRAADRPARWPATTAACCRGRRRSRSSTTPRTPRCMDRARCETAGATPVDWPHKTECCGASFSITDVEHRRCELTRRDPVDGPGRRGGLHRHRLPALPAQPGHAAEGHRGQATATGTTCRSSTSRNCWAWPWASPERAWARQPDRGPAMPCLRGKGIVARPGLAAAASVRARG